MANAFKNNVTSILNYGRSGRSVVKYGINPYELS